MKAALHQLTKRYGRTRALDEVTLEFNPGEIVAVLGPNGAGKTTLLRCLAGIASPNQGTVLYDDRPFRRDDLATRQRFFFVPDFPFLFWDQTLLGNVGLILRLYGKDSAGMADRVFELLRDFDLVPLAASPVGRLSRGQMYKTMLVALIAADPEVWLLDEPMASGMDPLGQSAFRRLAREAANRGRTIIYSTQMLEVAERFSDRLCVLHQGQVRAFDTLENLRAAGSDRLAALEELFLSLRSGGA